MNFFRKNCRVCIFVASVVAFSLLLQTISWTANTSEGNEKVWDHPRLLAKSGRHLLGSINNIDSDESINENRDESDSYVKFNPSGISFGEEKLKNTTLVLSGRLKELAKRLSAIKDHESDKFSDKPAKELAKVNLPEVPMVYQSRSFMVCGRPTLKLLILVLTEYDQKKERQLIRETWANFKKNPIAAEHELKWRVAFVVGRSYHEAIRDTSHVNEAIFNHDMINVHAKSAKMMGTMYGALHWIHNSCSYENVLVIRPTMAVNVPKVYALLHSIEKSKKNYFLIDSIPSTLNKEYYDWVESTMLIMSHTAVSKMMGFMKVYANSFQPLHYNIIWKYLDILKAERLQHTNLISEPLCSYQEAYVINAMPVYSCLNVIGFAANTSLKNKKTEN